jgi:hypothetical protein
MLYVQRGIDVRVSFQARFHHLPQNTHQVRVLQRGGYPLLVCKLLVDLLCLAMRALLDPYFYSVAGWQGLL